MNSVRWLMAAFLTSLLMACGGDEGAEGEAASAQQPAAVQAVDPWDAFIDGQIEAYLEAHPAWAVGQGRHEFDGQLPDWSAAGLDKEVSRLRKARRDAAAFTDDGLSAPQRYQREYFLWRMDHDLFWLEKARWPYRNPQFYIGWLNDSLDPAPYITLDYAPLDQRMAAFTRYLEAIPQAAKQIRTNLRMPMPEPWLQLGVDAFGGYATYFRDDVPGVWAAVEDPELQRRFTMANEAAITAMDELAQWLESGRNIADDRYALGADLYLDMLWDTERVRIDLDTLENVGRADMQRNINALREACAEFAAGSTLRECMDQMAARKPEGGSVETARRQLEETRAFLEAENLVSIPGTERALVNESPPYARSNFAYISIPGPWEENQPSVYYISPPNPDWPEDVQKSYVAGESDLLFTSIHEVWPGHFLNFMHANRAPWLFGRAFVTYAYGEGWAHYTEEMMLEAGLRGADPETRIGQISNALLRNARFLASIGLHTQGWSVEQAKEFFIYEAFQSEGTAIQQSARGTYDPAYLNYTMGKLLISQLREDWTKERGGRDAWREFHDTLLTLGGPPIPLARQQLMMEPAPEAVFPDRQYVAEAENAPPVAVEPSPQEETIQRDNWAFDCDDGRYVVSSYTDEGLRLFLQEGPRDLERVEAASGAKFEAEDIMFWLKGEEAMLEVAGETTNCRVNAYQTLWVDADLRGAHFRAVGNEPGWSLELFSDGPSTLSTAYGSEVVSFLAEGPEISEDGQEQIWTSGESDRPIRVLLGPGPCQDTMADIEYQNTVSVEVDGRVLTGCGNVLNDA